MNPQEILKFCLEKGILLDEEIFKLFTESTSDKESMKMIIERIKESTHERVITRELFDKNKEKVSEFFMNLPTENQNILENLKIKLGLSIEISKEIQKAPSLILEKEIQRNTLPAKEDENVSKFQKDFSEEPCVKIIPMIPEKFLSKKIEVGDFVNHFKNRFSEIKIILENRNGLDNLVSINKISGSQKISLIGLVSDKRVTKNGNIVFDVEDLTGKIKIIVNKNKPEIYEKAVESVLDSVIAFKCSGNKEILFANDILFPDSAISERKKSPVEECAVFISDLQYGSKLFIKESFEKFINYLNCQTENSNEARKIKYLFIAGDLVSGIGVYPGQEKDLEINNIEEQFIGLANLLQKIRKDIHIIISPGNHDGVRLMEPQPLLEEKYSWPLHDLPNALFTTNPSYVNIGAKKNFEGFDILIYHGFSYPYYTNNVPSLIKQNAINSPDKIMSFLLKNRHLSPTHSSTQYYPSEKDLMMIRKVPDIFLSGHLHKLAISYHNNILLISGSSWEKETKNQQKRGNKPDFCKVPMFNLKTREIKILDFEEKEDE